MSTPRCRILYVFGEFPPWMYFKDGGQIPIWLARFGHEVTMLFSNPGGTERLNGIDHLRPIGIKGYVRIQPGSVMNPRLWLRVLALCRTADMVFAFWGVMETPFVLLAKILWKKTLVLKMDNDGHVRETPRAYPRLLDWLVFSLADLVAIESPEAKELFASEFPLVSKKLVCLPNGFPDRQRNASAERKEGESAAPTILFVGVLIERKGIDLLLEAFGRLSYIHKNWTLKLVGEETRYSRELLRSLASEHKLADKIVITGRVSRQALEQAYEDADIFCLPSRKEASSIALLEALSYGKAIVASDAGSAAFVLDHGRAGLVVPSGDTNSLERALDQVMSNAMLRGELGARAKQRAAEKFAWSRVVQDLSRELAERGLLVRE